MSDIQFHTMPGGRRIAFRYSPARDGDDRAAIVFLPGYMSDMDGGKATALFEDCRQNGRACLLLDYSGCGRSEGAFADGTLSRWRDEVLALIDAVVDRPVVLVGSSMGGWLMLMVGKALRQQLAGMIGIAAAPDFTRWGFDDAQRAAMASGNTVYEENPYGPEPTPTHPGFFADAEANLMLHDTIALTCPARLLHGQADADVPWETSLRLAEALASPDVVVSLIKDGDHRLSRDADIARLVSLAGELT